MSTIKDVAKLAGTSIATVSRVINGKPVKEINYINVNEAMKQLKYSVNLYARSLKTQKTMIVGLVIPNLDDVYFMKIAKVIQEELYKRGYSVFLVESGRDFEREQEQVKILISKKVDGIIVTPVSNKGAYLKQYVEEVPIVLLDQLVDDFETDAVVPGNIKCVYEATKSMIKSGHRRIGLIGGQQYLFTARERVEAYKKALSDCDIEISEELIKCREYNEKSGYDFMDQFLNMDINSRPTAVITTNYDLTKGAIMAVRKNGFRIPEDLSFVGYDFEDLTTLYLPKLNIIVEPINRIANKVVEILYKKMNLEIDMQSKGIYRIEPKLLKLGSVQKLVK